METGTRVAIIGAGLAGCLVAHGLARAGARPELFDKSRGTGGRLASARLGEFSADLGAPLIDDDSAARLLGISPQCPLERWSHRRARFDTAEQVECSVAVAVPRASALTRHLLQTVPLHSATRIIELQSDPRGWWLRAEQGERFGPYARVVVATPAPQAVPLLAAAPALQQRAAAVEMAPAWVMLVQLARPIAALAGIDRLEAGHALLARACRDSAKPGRAGEIWQLQARSDWSAGQLQADPVRVGEQLLQALAERAGEGLTPIASRVHRWLYAEVVATPGVPTPVDDCGLAVCGDWTLGRGLAAAIGSAERVLGALEPDR